jgi:hypothetical protein
MKGYLLNRLCFKPYAWRPLPRMSNHPNKNWLVLAQRLPVNKYQEKHADDSITKTRANVLKYYLSFV